MDSTILLAGVSTVIIGGIVLIVFNLFFSSKSDDEGNENESLNEPKNCEFVDNRQQKQEQIVVEKQDVLKPQTESKAELIKNETEEVIEPVFEVDHQQNDQQKDLEKRIDDILNFGENNETENLLTDEKPVNKEVVEEVIPKDEAKITENELNPESIVNLIDQITEDQLNEAIIDVSEEPVEHQKENDLKDEFWDLEDTQNLMHLNKSRPKKSKSRPSVKIVFTDESSNKKSKQELSEDPISQSARELVENLFENLGSDLEEFKNKSDSENSADAEEWPEEKKTDESIVFQASDDTFEEIATGDYKNFDEFTDSFRSETQKQETIREVYEISTVKNYEITVDSRKPLNDKMIEELMKNLEANQTKTEIIEDNYSKVTECESIEVKTGDKTQVFPIRNEEKVSNTKTFSERSLSSSSLSKTSLEDLDLNFKSSKSRLSETIDSVTKPLLSSPTLFRRSIVSDEELGADSGVNQDSQSRVQLPIFGKSQSSLMEEMKKKEFRKSLKPLNDSDSDKNLSNE